MKRLLALPESALSNTRRTRILVIAALCDGDGTTGISRAYRVSRETIRKNRNQIRLNGLDAVLAEIASATSKRIERDTRLRRHRGRPKIPTFQAALPPKRLGVEP